ncbi:unnamed protein product [Rotaria sordida]|uniref:Uncharacterized protein n=1 Tax=Rotaria sordida TaxID=392033 RepID=A0A818UI16_9BILA|nr:unnamed protein product [Rotaria sordida]CAF3698675.1 unnamed protein product [Rotaria sordida]
MMNRLQTELIEQLPQTILQEQSCNLTNTNQDNNTFVTNPNVNDHQANMRRRAPTRHSIKSLTNRKTLSKQNSTKERNIFDRHDSLNSIESDNESSSLNTEITNCSNDHPSISEYKIKIFSFY